MKRLVVLVVCVGTLAFLPWALAATGNRDHARNQDQSAPPAADNPTVTGQLAARHSHQASVDLHAVRDQLGIQRYADDSISRLPRQTLQAFGISRAELEQRREAYELAKPDTDPSLLPDLDQLRPTLEPRRPIAKRPTEELVIPEDFTGTLIVKFRDEVQMRVEGADRLVSRAGVNVTDVSRLIRRLGLEMEAAFLRSEQELRVIETRAAIYSGKDQPDLAGMLHLTGPEQSLARAARTLNEMDIVEFVEFERVMQTGDSIDVGLPEIGACCTPDDFGNCTGCVRATEDFCTLMAGDFQGPGTFCSGDLCDISGACCLDFTAIIGEWICEAGVEGHAACEAIADALGVNGYFQDDNSTCVDPVTDDPICDDFDVACGECGSGPCFSPHLSPYCEIEFICDGVCGDIDPFCCGEAGDGEVIPGRGPQRWDAICAMHAAPFGVPFDPPIHPSCVAAFGPCFEVHPGTGCSGASCCGIVCDINPNCCELEWNAACVQLANSVCAVGAQLAEDLSPLQGYLTPNSYVTDLGGIPDVYRQPPFSPLIPATGGNPLDPADETVLAVPGFGGEGYDLEQFDALAEFLFSEYGIGHNPDMPGAPTSRGETIRAGVIEHSAHVQPFDPEESNHAALKHVKSEPGQTVMNIPGSANLTGDHGTAVLGIIGGKDRIVGVAPETDNYFFPIVSAEEGGRLGRAVVSAIQAFGPGDVLNFSIGPGGCGTLASSARNWLLLNLASDVGITSTISAGNSCCNLDGIAQAGGGGADSDVIIVGAVYPGRGMGNQHCRLGFSNYCNDCTAPHQVHVGSWGTHVTTAGYGDLFFEAGADNPTLNHYTHTFSGTSAAAPLVAGIVARVQSFAKQFYGIPLTPAQVRSLIAGNGWSQCSTTVGQCEPPGHTTPNACPGSWNLSADGDYIGLPCEDNGVPPVGMTALFALGETLISSEFFDCSPFHQEIHTIRGELQSGNIFSVCGGTPPVPCAADGNFYIAESQPTNQNSSPVNVPEEWASALNNVTYNVSGHVADVLLVGKAPQDTVLDLGIGVVAQGPLGVAQSIIFVQVYDWTINHWMYVGSAVTGPGILTGIVSDAGLMTSPQRFVNDDDQTILVRVWAFGFNTPSGPGDTQQNNFQFPIDCINLTVGTPSFGPSPLD